MEFKSIYKKCHHSSLKFPQFNCLNIYMLNLQLSDLISNTYEALKPYRDILNIFYNCSPVKNGNCYLTIDEKEIYPGETHRRGGKHFDGIWIDKFTEWDTAPRWSTNPVDDIFKNGMLMASNYSACKVYDGIFKGTPGEGGHCEEIFKDAIINKEEILKENNVYWLHGLCVHESLPLKSSENKIIIQSIKRQLIRLSIDKDAY